MAQEVNPRLLQIQVRYYQRQLEEISFLLTQSRVPQWVQNQDSQGVPSNAPASRLKWYLARRKDVSPKEGEPTLQREMAEATRAADEWSERERRNKRGGK